jgi:hypothetical protein
VNEEVENLGTPSGPVDLLQKRNRLLLGKGRGLGKSGDFGKANQLSEHLLRSGVELRENGRSQGNAGKTRLKLFIVVHRSRQWQLSTGGQAAKEEKQPPETQSRQASSDRPKDPR